VKFIKAAFLLFLTLALVPVANAQCQVNIIPVTFGSLDNLNVPVDSNGQVSVTCSLPTTVAIQLDAGANSNGLFLSRKLCAGVAKTLN